MTDHRCIIILRCVLFMSWALMFVFVDYILPAMAAHFSIFYIQFKKISLAFGFLQEPQMILLFN